jgi:hypothetical protein
MNRHPGVWISARIAGTLIVAAAALVAAGFPRQHRLPRFEDYPVREVYHGRPAPVDLSSSPDARRFRTVLREGARRGPNFAGHYTVVEWGCGSNCHVYGIVDARTGRVWITPWAANLGAEYRLDSSLFVIDPRHMWVEAYGDAAPEAFKPSTVYYRWTGTHLVKVDSVLLWPRATP